MHMQNTDLYIIIIIIDKLYIAYYSKKSNMNDIKDTTFCLVHAIFGWCWCS